MTDNELAAQLIAELRLSEPPNIHQVRTWLADKIVSTPGREYGAADTWRAVLPRASGIAFAALNLLETVPPSSAASRPGLPPTSLSPPPAGVEQFGGMTPEEIAAIPADQWGRARQALGIYDPDDERHAKISIYDRRRQPQGIELEERWS